MRNEQRPTPRTITADGVAFTIQKIYRHVPTPHWAVLADGEDTGEVIRFDPEQCHFLIGPLEGPPIRCESMTEALRDVAHVWLDMQIEDADLRPYQKEALGGLMMAVLGGANGGPVIIRMPARLGKPTKQTVTDLAKSMEQNGTNLAGTTPTMETMVGRTRRQVQRELSDREDHGDETGR